MFCRNEQFDSEQFFACLPAQVGQSKGFSFKPYLNEDGIMGSIDEQVLKTAKEIVVKFIETGRISPSGFPEAFKSVYMAVYETVTGVQQAPETTPSPAQPETKGVRT